MRLCRPEPPDSPRALPPPPPPPATERSFSRFMRKAVDAFLGRHLEGGRLDGDAFARLGPRVAKALVAKHVSASYPEPPDWNFRERTRAKVRAYVDDYVRRRARER